MMLKNKMNIVGVACAVNWIKKRIEMCWLQDMSGILLCQYICQAEFVYKQIMLIQVIPSHVK